MKTWRIIGLMWILAAPQLFAEGALYEVRAEYEAALRSEESRTDKQVEGLKTKFVARLKGIEREFQKVGDLENLLSVKKERGRFEKEGKLASSHVKRKPENLGAAQKAFIAARQKILAASDERKKSAGQKHLVAVEALVGKLTKERKIEEALAARKAAEEFRKRMGLSRAKPKVASTTPGSTPVKKDFGTRKLTPVADAWVRGSEAYRNRNYGEGQALQVMNSPTYHRRKQRSYLKFDLSGVDTVVRMAKLRLTVTGRYNAHGKPSPDAEVHNTLHTLPNESWDEKTITFVKRPFRLEEFAKWKVPGLNETVEIDITTLVRKAMDDGHKTLSVHLYPVERGKRVHYASREHTSADARPVLVIN